MSRVNWAVAVLSYASVAVSVYAPSVVSALVPGTEIDHAPEASAVTLDRVVVLFGLLKVTVLPASALPLMVGVVSLVMLSASVGFGVVLIFGLPVSEVVFKLAVICCVVVSILMVIDCVLLAPAASLAVTTRS